MKKNVLLVVLMITIATIMVGCGNKNTEKTTENNEVVESVTTETTQEVEETTEEPITEEPVEEEVIGDMDVAADGLTMADMTEQVIGLDIPMIANEGTDKETFDNFTVIFPSPMFITGYSDNGASAKLESIDFEIQAVLTIGEPSNNIREEMGESQEYIGNYVLEKRAGGNDNYAYQMSYRIINPTNNNKLMITLTINKESEYQEYGNQLADEFSVAFEESIRKNLK